MAWFDVSRVSAIFDEFAGTPAPQFEPAERMRHAHQRNLHRALAAEIGDPGGIEPTIGRSDRRRLGEDRKSPVALADHCERGPRRKIGFDDNNFFAVAEIGHARFEILEHGILAETDDVALAVPAFDDERSRFDGIAQHAMTVTGGRFGEPGARDPSLARGNAPVRQGIRRNRRIARRRCVLQPDFFAVGNDGEPAGSGRDARLPSHFDQFEHRARRLDCFNLPSIGARGGRRDQDERADQSEHQTC
jgi:hypothetical protein